jgi:hypothetical protein
MITTVGELAAADSNFFLWSEYVLASCDWPVLGFTNGGHANQIRRYRPGRDFIFWVGTSKAPTDRELRSRLLSLVRLDAEMKELVTRDVVTEEAWRKKCERGTAEQWNRAFKVVEAWDVQGHPSVNSYAPKAYKLRQKRRGIVLSEVGADEREALLSLEVKSVVL